jgi:hypothetical protein
MPETATRYDNDTVDWLALADQLFPAEALRATPVLNSRAFVRSRA